MNKLFLAFGLALCLQNFAVAAALNVRISNIRSNKGVIRASVYNSKTGFPSGYNNALKSITLPAQEGSLIIQFDGLNEGEAAVSAVHDENNNGKVDTRWPGIPTEGVGASNNPKSKFGPPSYKSASFKIESSSATVEINLNYF